MRRGVGDKACAGMVSGSQKKHATNSGTTRNCVCHGHQGRMQGGGNTPHNLIPSKTGKTECRQEIDGTGGICGKAKPDQDSRCRASNHCIFYKIGLAFFVDQCLFLFGSEFHDFVNISNRRRWWSKWSDLVRPSGIAAVANQHVLDSVVLEIDLEDALFLCCLWSNAQYKFGNIVSK